MSSSSSSMSNNSNNYSSNSNNNMKKKQGAYGKIPTHAESKLSQLLHISEVLAAIQLLYVKPMISNFDEILQLSSSQSTSSSSATSSSTVKGGGGGGGGGVELKSSMISKKSESEILTSSVSTPTTTATTTTITTTGSNGASSSSSVFNVTDLQFCNTILTSVSRSFASVIHQLPSNLLVDIMIFYLVLRALDTIEDDMEFFHHSSSSSYDDPSTTTKTTTSTTNTATTGGGVTAASTTPTTTTNEGEGTTTTTTNTTTTATNNTTTTATTANNDANAAKIAMLLSFHKTALVDPTWKLMGCGHGEERRLLEQFPQCHSIFAALSTTSRHVILDITCRMASGMAEFVNKDLGQGTSTIQEYNRYCHFVAGLVGEGLTRLFVSSGLETHPTLVTMGEEMMYLSDQMGLFLQKTNILRDYLEDYVDGRAFWPMEVWKKYVPTTTSGGGGDGDGGVDVGLGYFANPTTPDAYNAGLTCLDELITDALELVPDCLSYLSKLNCAEIFRFCAIPQVMAIATLEKCYHNDKVFTGVVKIRKGTSCWLINHAVTLEGVHGIFHEYAKKIERRTMVFINQQQQQQKKKNNCDGNGGGGGNDEQPLFSYERTMEACRTILELTRPAVDASSTTKALVGASCAAVAGIAVAISQVGGGGSPSFRSGSMLTAATATTTTVVALSFVGLRSFFVGGDKTKRRSLSTEEEEKHGSSSSSSRMKLLPAAKIMEQRMKGK